MPKFLIKKSIDIIIIFNFNLFMISHGMEGKVIRDHNFKGNQKLQKGIQMFPLQAEWLKRPKQTLFKKWQLMIKSIKNG